MRLRKFTIDGEKTLQEVANLPTSRASRCSAFQRMGTILTGLPEPVSRSSARRSEPPTVGVLRAENHCAGSDRR